MTAALRLGRQSAVSRHIAVVARGCGQLRDLRGQQPRDHLVRIGGGQLNNDPGGVLCDLGLDLQQTEPGASLLSASGSRRSAPAWTVTEMDGLARACREPGPVTSASWPQGLLVSGSRRQYMIRRWSETSRLSRRTNVIPPMLPMAITDPVAFSAKLAAARNGGVSTGHGPKHPHRSR